MQLAFILKLSIVGARKMEQIRTTTFQSLGARNALFSLAKTLDKPSLTIAADIEREKVILEG
jgi:hypothetical protein